MNLYVVSGFLIGLTFFLIMDNGENKKPLLFHSIIIKCMNNKYHLHHWMIFTLLFLILIPIVFVYKYTSLFALLIGICLGSILQGLTYNDAFNVKIK